jgi:hypothetical protein
MFTVPLLAKNLHSVGRGRRVQITLAVVALPQAAASLGLC